VEVGEDLSRNVDFAERGGRFTGGAEDAEERELRFFLRVLRASA